MSFIFRLKSPDLELTTDEPTVVTGIREPVKWSDVQLIGEVDPDWHGFNYNYSDGQIQLEFTKNAAARLIRDNYDRYGVDAVILFQVVDTGTDPETIDYAGRLDMSTVKFLPGKVACSVVQDDIQQKIKNRWDTPVNLSAYQSLDGVSITPPAKTILNLTGQFVLEEASLNNTKLKSEEFTFAGESGMANYIHPLPNLNPDDANKQFALSGMMNTQGNYVGHDVLDSTYWIDCEAEGEYVININWIFKLDASIQKKVFSGLGINLSKIRFSKWVIEAVLEVRDPVNGTQKINMATPQTGGGEANNLGTRNVNARYSGTLQVTAGTKIFWYGTFKWVSNGEVKQTVVNITTLQTAVSVKRKTKTAASQTVKYDLPAVARHVFGAITSAVDSDGYGRLYGSVVDKAGIDQPTDGPAVDLAVTSGYHLRITDKEAPFLQKSPDTSLKDVMETLNGLYAAGMQYEKDEDGNDRVRIENQDWFYRGGEILVIDEVYEYTEEPDNDLLIAQLEIGYDKFADEGPGVAEEFNTTRTYQTPLTGIDKKISIKVPYIGAGTMIEQARRLSFTKKDASGNESTDTTAAGQYDDDIFLLHVMPQTLTNTVIFVVEQPTTVYPFVRYFIRFSLLGFRSVVPGDTISIVSGLNAGRTYVASNVKKSLLYADVEVLPGTMIAGMGQVTFSLLAKPSKVRTNERLKVTGITDPSTTYNLELSPARMLLAHAPLLIPGCKGKRSTTELKLTFVKHNAAMMSQVLPSSGLLPNDPDKLLVKEGKSIQLGLLRRIGYRFAPEKIQAKARLRRADLRLLLDAMRGKGDEDKQKGYVRIKNPDGEYVEGYVRRIAYNPCQQVVELTLRKRFDSATMLPSCDDYRGWTFEQFVNDLNADPDLYLFCKFGDLESL